MISAVLLPALFVLLLAEGLFLAVTYGLDTAAVDTLLDQGFFYAVGALGSQGEIVELRAAIVAVSFDEHFVVWMLAQKLCIVLRTLRFVGTNFRVVKVEVHVLDVPGEQIAFVRPRHGGLSDRV